MKKIISNILIYFIKLQNNIFKKHFFKNIILINWHGKLGDAIISSFFIKALLNNNYKVTVLSHSTLETLYIKDYNVTYFIGVDKISIISIFLKTKNYKVGAIIPPFGTLNTTDLFFLSLLPNAKIFSSDARLPNDIVLNNMPIKQAYIKILQKIGIDNFSQKYIIPNHKKINNTFFIIFNPFGSRTDKSLSIEKSIDIIKKLSLKYKKEKILLLASPKTYTIATSILYKCNNLSNIFLIKIRNYYDMFDLIYLATYIITVDTSVAHIASELNKKSIIVYRNFEEYNPWIIKKTKNTEFIFSNLATSNKEGICFFDSNDIMKKLHYWIVNE
ncbi:glycosyltransferase family 9 protein [Campylobacter concisus]